MKEEVSKSGSDKRGDVRVRTARLGEVGLKEGFCGTACKVYDLSYLHISSVVRDQVGNLARRGICAILNTWVSIFAP